MASHTNCLICGSNKIKTLNGYEHAHLVKCKNCHFVFSLQIPTQQELIAHYEGYGRDDYLSDITIKRYNEVLDEFEKYRKNNRILDIGCGVGYFLEVAKQRGWDVYGTEFTDEAVQICEDKGIQMHQGVLDPSNYQKEYFDVITSIEVIEHINNPLEETGNIAEILRQGGVFYFTTPNFNSLLRYRLKEGYNVIVYPEHLSYYTPKTINRLFKSQGFRKKWLKTTGISLTRYKTSQKVSNQDFISEQSDDEKLREKIDKSVMLELAKKVVNTVLTIFGVGDSLKGLYQKK